MTQPPPPGFPPGPPGYPAYQAGPPPGYPPYGWPPGYPPPPVSPGGVPLADFGTRLLAALIDGVILGVVLAIVAIPAFIIVMSHQTQTIIDSTNQGDVVQPDPAQFFGAFLPILLLELGLGVFILIVYYVYHVELFYKSGQTVGKRVMKIRVIPLDPTQQLTRGKAAVRYLVEFAAGTIVPFLPYLDGLWQLWDKPYQQTLHDKAAQTVVIKVSV